MICRHCLMRFTYQAYMGLSFGERSRVEAAFPGFR